MVDMIPQVEVTDAAGSTAQFAGTVGTSPINIPTVAGNNITAAMVRCPIQSPNSRQLQYSFDGGTTFHKLEVGEAITWPLKGNPKQIQVKANGAGVEYEVLLNLDQAGEL